MLFLTRYSLSPTLNFFLTSPPLFFFSHPHPYFFLTSPTMIFPCPLPTPALYTLPPLPMISSPLFHIDILLPRHLSIPFPTPGPSPDHSPPSPCSSENPGFCQDSTFTITTEYNNGARPCECNIDGSKSFQCQKYGGQCDCKDHVIGRTCSQCKTGFYGFPNCKRELLLLSCCCSSLGDSSCFLKIISFFACISIFEMLWINRLNHLHQS